MVKKCYLLLLLAYYLKLGQCQEVNTSLGKIRGYVKTSHGGRKFSAFEGIPYAKPPTGNKRFAEPEPVEPWNGVLEASSPTVCCQIDMINVTLIYGQEDCLHINVYVPKEEPNSKDNLDVTAYVHGGSFLYGSAHNSADPNYIMDRDIILVTFNYRLGVFGFLSTEDDIVPGNNGLKDQVLALKWVQQNIASFGGNPDSVTLMGLSAGGASVHLHYFSDMSKGLFHRGFSQSGVALNSWAIQKKPLDKAKILADALNCSTLTTSLLVECLKEKSFEDILAKEPLFFEYMFIPFTTFAPVVEKGSKPFLKDDPYRLLSQGKVHDLPWLVSNTAHEGMFPTELLVEDIERVNKDWNTLAPIFFDYNYTLDSSQWTATAQKIKEFYLKDKEGFSKENPLELANIFSDRLCLSGTEKAIRLQANVSKSTVYFYLFSYPGEKKTTVAHGDDKKYFFGKPKQLSENELKVKDIVLDMLISFTRNGQPTINGTSWEPVTYSSLNYLNLSGFEEGKIKHQTADELAPNKFWTSLGILDNENLLLPKNEL